MTQGIKTLRLSKVAREFNLGITTIVEFLNKKGYNVVNNPNTKISDDAYNLLIEEFQAEKSFKEATEKARRKIEKLDEKLDNDKPVDEKSDSPQKTPKDKKKEQDESTKESVIKDEKPSIDSSAEVKTEGIKLQGPKILGKIDTGEKGEDVKKKKEEKATIDDKEEKNIEDKEKKKAINEADEKEAKETNKAEKPSEKDQVSEKEKKKTKAEKDTKKESVKKSKEEEKKSKPISDSKLEKPESKAEEGKKEDKTKTPGESDISDEKIDAVNQRKLELDEEQTKNLKVDEKKRGENFHTTEFEKLEGVTILGKMDLPKSKDITKKPVASSSDDPKHKKRKRKRIKKEKPQEVKSEKEGQKPKKEEQKQRPQQAKTKKKPQTKKEQSRPEFSEEEISKQIRETLASLSGTRSRSKAAKYRRQKRDMVQQQKLKEQEKVESENKTLEVTEFISANELANMMDVNVTKVISACMNLGMFVSINQRLDAETITIVVDEFGYTVEFVSVDDQDVVEEEEDDPNELHSRAPIVTVMGHVDHGKTSLLDHIRQANVIAGEAGSITQHIGAYSVELENGKFITFLDTPGHEAFTAMRARGAKITDVVIIVVAADDSVMPQTKEAINHAQAAGVPIIIAINKIDKPNANPEKVKEELAGFNILVEEWGGKYQSQEISAKQGKNIENLLEKVLLESELLESEANPSKTATGTVVESMLDKGRGYITTILVQNGTLKVGDMVVAGSYYGKVKAMFNERGMRIKDAGPSVPVLILGLNGAPQAGEKFNVINNEQEAKNIAAKRQQLVREQGLRAQKHVTLDEIGRRIAIGDFKELNIVVKGDVDGSIEALSDSLLKLSTEEVQVNIIHKAVGPITEGDVLLASASNAIIIGFQVRPSMPARKLAEQEEIDIRLYSVIYNAINEIKSAIEGMLSPEIEEKIRANIEIREVFKISKVGSVAGCYVLDGKIHRNSDIRVIRDGIVVYTGKLGSLKRFKEDVKEVHPGYECGLNVENFNDIKVGDIIEAFETVEIARKLE